MFEKIGIVGLGLIGGSLAKLIREFYPHQYIIAFDQNTQTCDLALKENIVTKALSSIQECSENLDLIFVCTPISNVNPTIQLISECCGDSVLITDVASIKQGIGEFIPLKKTQRFIGGHPMAGTEKQGYIHSSAEILRNAKYILTGTLTERDLDFQDFLKSLSFQLIFLSSHEHDRLLAHASHFPYLMALLTVKNTESCEDLSQLKRIISSGFRDTTRVSSSPVKWAQDICNYNKDNLLALIENSKSHLLTLEHLIQEGDQKGLETFFDHGKHLKETLK